MRSRFDQQLSDLNHELIHMGALCEEAIAIAAKALLEGEPGMAAEVGHLESEIDGLEHGIESLCLKLLLQQQPVARDLRQISAALKMITDIERIGDQALDIAEIARYLGGRGGSGCEYIADMARAAVKMVTESIDAFVKQDTDLAEAVAKHDDVVDSLFCDAKRTLIAYIAAHPDDGEYAMDLLMTAKYFERIADHAVNISEWVVFSVTGTHKGETEP